MVKSTNYRALSCKCGLWVFLCFGREILGSIPRYAFTFDNSTDSSGCINIKSSAQYVFLLYGEPDTMFFRELIV